MIGFSTGAIEGRQYTPKAKLLLDCGLEAIELSCLKCEELMWLANELFDDLKPVLDKFKYVSIHLPSDAKKPMDEDAIIDYVAVFKSVLGRDINFIVHPDAVINWDRWRWISSNLVIENMDARKPFGQTHDSLSLIFKMLPHAKFCLDTAHAYSSGWWAIEFKETSRALYFSDRIAQVHVSAMLSGKHGKLSSAKYRDLNDLKTTTILSLLEAGVPKILEAPVSANKNEIIKEVEALKRLC